MMVVKSNMSIIKIKQNWCESVIKLRNCFNKLDVLNFFDIVIANMDKVIDKKIELHILPSIPSIKPDEQINPSYYPSNLEIINERQKSCETINFDYDYNFEIMARNKPIIDEIKEILYNNLCRLNSMQSIIIPLHWFLLVHMCYNQMEECKILTHEIRHTKICFIEELMCITDENTRFESLNVVFKQQFGCGLKIFDFKIATPVRFGYIIDYLTDIYYGIITLCELDSIHITENINTVDGFNKNIMYVLMCVAIRESVNKLKNTDKSITFSIAYDNENDILAGYNYFKNNSNKCIKYVINDIKNMIQYEKENYKMKLRLADLHETNVKYQWTNSV